MGSPEKLSNLIETQGQNGADLVESQKIENQNEFFGRFLSEEEIEKAKMDLSQIIEKYHVPAKEYEKKLKQEEKEESKKNRENDDQDEIEKLKKEIGLIE